MISKKGQQESGFVIVGIVIAVALLALVLIFLFGGFGPINDIFSRFPAVSVAAQTCNSLASLELTDDYCSVPKRVEIDGLKQYMTCGYLKGTGKATWEMDLPCGPGVPSEDSLVAFCDNQKLSNSSLVNGQSCESLKRS